MFGADYAGGVGDRCLRRIRQEEFGTEVERRRFFDQCGYRGGVRFEGCGWIGRWIDGII